MWKSSVESSPIDDDGEYTETGLGFTMPKLSMPKLPVAFGGKSADTMKKEESAIQDAIIWALKQQDPHIQQEAMKYEVEKSQHQMEEDVVKILTPDMKSFIMYLKNYAPDIRAHGVIGLESEFVKKIKDSASILHAKEIEELSAWEKELQNLKNKSSGEIGLYLQKQGVPKLVLETMSNKKIG